MALSAADRVFAITEILEQILLECEFTTREIFRLQCVNRSFNHTINGSTPLLRTMEILHKPREQKKHRVPNPMLWTSQLELRPFTYRIEVLAPASPRNDGTDWKVNVHVILNLGSEARVVNSSTAFGIKGNRRCFGSLADGSWRRMKIARFPVLIEVPLRVHYLDVSYEEKVSDPTGEMTLGDLAMFLSNVHARSEGEHRQKAREFENLEISRGAVPADTSSCQVS